MLRKVIGAAFVLALLSTPAAAFHCPKDIKAIDAALQNTKLSDVDKSKVKKLRDEGETLHKAGKHKESVAKLAEALQMLRTSK